MTGGERAQIAYLDHAATTPMRAEAVAAMLPFLADSYGNASGGHSVARAARRALDDARELLAGLLGASPGELVFTSGGTEADNLAVLGAAGRPGHAQLCSAVEHPAVLEACRAVGGRVVAVDRRGVVDLDALRDVLDGRVRVVSVMLVNNETEPTPAARARRRGGARARPRGRRAHRRRAGVRLARRRRG